MRDTKSFQKHPPFSGKYLILLLIPQDEIVDIFCELNNGKVKTGFFLGRGEEMIFNVPLWATDDQ